MARLDQPGDAGLVPPIRPVAPPWGIRGAAGSSRPSSVRSSCRRRPRFRRGLIPR